MENISSFLHKQANIRYQRGFTPSQPFTNPLPSQNILLHTFGVIPPDS
ncbi:MAG: hypothetical protein ACI85I_002380 [Arenicella sp.]|jgi:hypothetical protein